MTRIFFVIVDFSRVKRFGAYLTLTALFALLSACSSGILSNDKVNYKSQSTAKPTPLEVPPDLSQLSRDSRYTLPGGTVSAAAGLESGKRGAYGPSTGNASAPLATDIKLERSGSQRWLVVKRPADKVWPVVREFWTENGFTFTTDQAATGLLETDWAENRAKLPQDFLRGILGKLIDGIYSTGERDKFRTRIDPIDADTTEITISHRGLAEEYADASKIATRWQPRPSDPSLEGEFLRRLMVKLGTSDDQAKQAVQAPVTAVATLITLEGNQPAIQYVEPFDVAWRRVGVALDRTGFTVEDRDRNQGLFFVRYVEKNGDDQGFFKRLFSGSNAKPEGPVRYRIFLVRDGSASRISVLNATGGIETGNTAQNILKLLIDELK
jgi:outer membrane protein assembly factor BamC